VRAFVTADGRIVSDAPTAYAMALVWDLLPTPQQRAGAGRRLADLVRAAGFRIATGFVGTPLIADALTAVGEHHLAYRLLLERGCPSWLYPITMGATTIWERWDSMLPDGSINPGEMTSFNHYALGAVADWLHRCVAGLAPAAPGYREILVRPIPGHALTSAAATLDTPYGRAAVAWRRRDGRFRLDVTVPPGATATVHVPGLADPVRVGPGEHRWSVNDPVPALGPVQTVRDAVDDEILWGELAAAAVEYGAADDPAAVAAVAARWLDHPVAVLPAALSSGPGPSGDRAKINAALAAVLARHGWS
jgi:alpha-L-rhamnosidase